MIFSPLEQFTIVPYKYIVYPTSIIEYLVRITKIFLYKINPYYTSDDLLSDAIYTHLNSTAFMYIPVEKFDKQLPFNELFFNMDPFSNLFMISNYSVYLFLIFIITYMFLLEVSKHMKFIPTLWTTIPEQLYLFVLTIVKQQAGKRGIRYFPLFFFVFVFILISNLIGIVPYSLTTTSLLIQNLFLSCILFIAIVFLTIYNFGSEFIYIFLPKGVPSWLLPIVFCIEILSFFSRPISLAVRLFANMLAGHTLLFIISSFVIKLQKVSILLALIPLIAVILIFCLEIAIACLQAYVFTVLLAIYFNGALYKH